MDEPLIATSNAETANQLRQLGYKELKTNNGLFTFVNKSKTGLFSSDIDENKLVFSNKMTF